MESVVNMGLVFEGNVIEMVISTILFILLLTITRSESIVMAIM